MKQKTLAIIAVTLFIIPYAALAATCTPPNVWNVSTLSGPLLSCLNGTCQSLCDLVCTATNVIYFGIAFVIWIIIPLMLVIGGIMYMMGGANPGLLETAKKAIWGAVIGAIIVLCAYILILTFVQFLNITKIGGFGTPACTISS